MVWDNPNDGTSDKGWVKWRFLHSSIRDLLSLLPVADHPLEYNEMEMLPFIGSGAGAHKTVTVLDGDVIAEKIGTDDEIYVFWHFPLNLDTEHDIQLEIAWYLPAAENNKKVSFDVSFTLANGDPINVSTDTVQLVDEPVPSTAYVPYESMINLDVHTYPAFADAHHMHIKIKRVVSSDDPAEDIRIHHVCVHYRRSMI